MTKGGLFDFSAISAKKTTTICGIMTIAIVVTSTIVLS